MNKIIMVLTNAFTPDIRVLKEAQYLSNKNYDIEILCWDRDGSYKDKPIEFFDKIKIIRFATDTQYGSGFKQISALFKFIKQCKKYLKDIQYNYIHCHDIDGMLVGLFAKKRKPPIIFDMHEYYFNHAKIINFIYKIIFKYQTKKSKNIIYVNNIQKNALAKRYQKKLVFLPNYPVISNYLPIEKTDSDKLRINYIGAVRDFNTYKILVDAVSGNTNIEVLFMGSGVSAEQFSKYVENIKNVNYGGVYNGITESAELYRKTDVVFCVYSRYNQNNRNAYAVKFFEAIVTNTPMIVSEDGVMAEIVKAQNIGYLVNEESVQDMKNLVNKIEKNAIEYQVKVNNLKKISAKYTWENVVSVLDNIYN